MTRLGKIESRGKLDVAGAFRILGVAPSYRELGLVVDLLHESGVEGVDYGDDLVELAEANGAGWHEALDLSTALTYGVESLYAGPPWARRSRDN